MRKQTALTVVSGLILVLSAVSAMIAIKASHSSIALSSVGVSEASLYQAKIQPIFSHRCASCHSCNTAPCQLNFTSYDGVIRGASKTPFYQGLKQSPVPPTRFGIDAQTEEGWRALGFFSVLDHDASDVRQSNLYQALELKSRNPNAIVKKQAESFNTCPAKPAEWESFYQAHGEAGMPYGLPALQSDELNLVLEWLQKGARGPNPEEHDALTSPLSEPGRALISRFEIFLNEPSVKSQIVARYLYEHLFLAHLHFQKDMPNEFYRLVRSRNACHAAMDEIASVFPYSDPGVAHFSYCFRKFDQVVAEKNHIVYEMSDARLQRWQDLFFGLPWSATSIPSYDKHTSANPFITFKDLPAAARYQWLLDDAQYSFMTFIKGAVCRGNTAVNVIDEQFTILFLDPKVDHFVQNPSYAEHVSPYLVLPGEYGNDVKFIKPSLKIVPFLITKLKNRRNEYREMRDAQSALDRPQGYSLSDIWNGNGSNQNAVLTVFRHYDSAQVLTGAWGPIPKTAWVVDYPIFERIVYNLVSGYDVFGSMGHQLLTRVYMHYIRMEAEENYLSFFPAEMRESLRASWYKDAPDINKRYPLSFNDAPLRPTQVRYAKLADPQQPQAWAQAKNEFFSQLYNEHLGAKVLGPRDQINASAIVGPIAPQIRSAQDFEHEMRKLVSQPAAQLPFSNYLDDTALVHLVVDGSVRNDRVYTFIRNKEHFNIASILGERGRRDPANDSLNVVPGDAASYPNRFFSVEIKNAAAFLQELQSIHTQAGIRHLLAGYGISRQDPNFWRHYDWFMQYFAAKDPVQAGIIDLVRYGNAEPLPEDDENSEQ